jgi:hypothetical protein
MNETLRLVHAWAGSNSLTINPIKSQVMIMSSHKTLNASPVFIGDNIIPYYESVLSLGLLLDSELLWEDHVSKVCKGVFDDTAMLYKSKHLTTLKTRMRLVRTLLIPKILFCCNMYMGCSRASWEKINDAVNACARYIYGLRKFQSVSTHSREIFECSIEILFHFRSCLFIFDLLTTKSPDYLYSKIIFPNGQRRKRLRLLERFSTKQYKNYFFVKGVTIWNSLISKMQLIDSLSVFRRESLTYFVLEGAQT